MNLYSILTLNYILEFILNNFFSILIISFTFLGICFDLRFTKKNKILIGLFLIFLFFFLLIFNINDLSIWVQELFWYSLLINISFIFHVCYLNWLYIYCWNNRYQYACFLVNRISFIFSLTFIIYIYIYYLRPYIYKLFKFLNYDYNKISLILEIILAILYFFMIVFINYSLLLQGKTANNFTLKNILLYILIFVTTLLISIFIFGIPRLYVLWIFLFLYKSYQVFIEYWEEENKKKIFTFFEIIKFLYNDPKLSYKFRNEIVTNKQQDFIFPNYHKPYLKSMSFLNMDYDSDFFFNTYILCACAGLNENHFKTIFRFKDWYSIIYDYWDENAWTWKFEFEFWAATDEWEYIEENFNLSEEERLRFREAFCLDDEVKFRELELKYWKKNVGNKK